MLGTDSLAASAASSPKPSLRPLALWTTSWLTALTSVAGTPQRLAAACSSMVRAEAPIWRIGIR